jgi:hypothetical protein
MEGPVTWKAVKHGPSMTFENPEVVRGVNLRGVPKNPLLVERDAHGARQNYATIKSWFAECIV